jgi:hypothetical protein
MSHMNMSGFKKTKEDAKTVTMSHPSGHEIKILKSKLPALQREQLKRLPLHLADGDEKVEAPLQGAGVGDLSQSPNDITANAQAPSEAAPDTSPPTDPDNGNLNAALANIPNGVYSQSPTQEPTGQASDVNPANLEGSQTAQAPSPSPAAGTSKPDMAQSGVDITGAYNQGQRAISEQQNVASQLAAANAKASQDNMDAIKVVQQDAKDNLAAFQGHKQDFQNYIANNPIDPKHYVENMGSLNKVSTAIGLLLGGFSGGFNHTGVNPAADFLNKQIDRDIEGQRSRMDQQKTILGANEALYHDQVLANNATRINMNDLYDRQIQQNAQKLGTPAAKAAADAAHSDLALKNAGLLQQTAIRGAALQAIQRGGAGIDPITLGQAGFMNPEEAQKEQSAFDAHKAGIARINDLYSQANATQTPANLLNPQSYKLRDAINSQLVDTFMSMDTAKRYSAESAKALLTPNLITTTDTPETAAVKQNNVIKKAQSEAAASMPNLTRLAPGALPNYGLVQANKINTSPADFAPGKIVYKNGVKAQVQSNGDLKAI